MFKINMIFAFALFSIGLYGVSSRKDFLRIFFSLEILINAVILMLALSAHYLGLKENIPLAYLIIILATLEAATGVLIFVSANKFTNATHPDELNKENYHE